MTDRGLWRTGVLGAGMVATMPGGYLPGIARLADRVALVAIASRTRSRAEDVARRFGIPAVYDDLVAMLEGADLDAVVNLTPGPDHHATSRAILAAGVHLVSEKPLAATMAEADELGALADDRGLVVVCAPMDVLSGEVRTAGALLAARAIGSVAFARASASHAGPATLGWPADPAPFYRRDVGALLDLGVYGLHRLTALLGPVRRVTARASLTDPVRTVRGGPYAGTVVDVEAPDNHLLLLEHDDGVLATLDATFNVVASRSPALEVHGSAGTIALSRWGQQPALEVFLVDARPGLSGWVTPVDLRYPPVPDRTALLGRAVLVEHLADCLDSGTPPLAGARHARHVLEVLLAADRSARTGRAVEVTSTFPAPHWTT